VEFPEGRNVLPSSARGSAVNEPILVQTTISKLVGKVWVHSTYAYMAARATIFDEQLIRDAERRVELRRKRADKT